MLKLAPLLVLLLLAACCARGEPKEAPQINGVPIGVGGMNAGRR